MDEAGHVLSVEYGQPGGGCRTRGDGLAQAPAVVALRSSASAKFAKDAPRLAFGPVRVTPDFVDDPAFGTDAQAAEGEDAEQKPKSVFERYWFIIVPLMLTNIMSAMAGGAKEQPAAAKKTN